MASRAILRKRRFVSDYLNVSARSIQCFQNLGHGLSSQHADSHGPIANHSSGDIDRMKKGDTILPINEDLLSFSALGHFRRKCYGDMVSGYATGGSQFGSPTGMRFMLQSVRYASTAAAGQRDVDAKIGDRWRLLDRDHDGEVKEVAAAAMNFISNLSKDIGCLQFFDKIPINVMSPDLNTDDLHRIFKNLDQNGDGFVSLTELELLIERIGMQSTQEELESLVGKTNLDLLDFESLYDAIVKRKIGGECQDGEDDDEELENDLVEAFKVYDQDGDGFISCKELERVLTQLGFLNENAGLDCNTMIDKYDMNSDGVLDFEEFKKMMLVIKS